MSSPSRIHRRQLIGGGLALLAAAAGLHAQAAAPQVEVWKDPNCGCCKEWVSHLQANGFQVKVNDTGNNAVRAKLGIGREYASCHTAVVGGYAIEGHVPAREIHRLLKEKPQALGLSVPGMPVGSPGMDGAIYGGRKDSYNVMLLARDGSAQVYQAYAGTETPAATSTPAAADAAWTEAEVRKVDPAAGKLTLKHGELKALDMPPMTMVFQVKDPAVLGTLKRGDKVRFKAANEGGNFVATEVQPLR